MELPPALEIALRPTGWIEKQEAEIEALKAAQADAGATDAPAVDAGTDAP